MVGSGPSCLKPSLLNGSVTLAADLAQRNCDGRLLVLLAMAASATLVEQPGIPGQTALWDT